MRKGIYGCTNCKKTFSRKYNAERHNKLIHNEIAVIYNIETEWTSNKRKTAEESYFPSSTPKETTINSVGDVIKNSTIGRNNLKNINHVGPYTQINKNTDEEKIIKIFEKITPYIDKLDNLLTKYKPSERIGILSDVIITTLTSSNPINYIKDLTNFYYTSIGIERAAALVATAKKIHLSQAKEMLKSFILITDYSKN